MCLKCFSFWGAKFPSIIIIWKKVHGNKPNVCCCVICGEGLLPSNAYLHSVAIEICLSFQQFHLSPVSLGCPKQQPSSKLHLPSLAEFRKLRKPLSFVISLLRLSTCTTCKNSNVQFVMLYMRCHDQWLCSVHTFLIANSTAVMLKRIQIAYYICLTDWFIGPMSWTLAINLVWNFLCRSSPGSAKKYSQVPSATNELKELCRELFNAVKDCTVRDAIFSLFPWV